MLVGLALKISSALAELHWQVFTLTWNNFSWYKYNLLLVPKNLTLGL